MRQKVYYQNIIKKRFISIPIPKLKFITTTVGRGSWGPLSTVTLFDCFFGPKDQGVPAKTIDVLVSICDVMARFRMKHVVFGFPNCFIWIFKFYFDRKYLPKLLLG